MSQPSHSPLKGAAVFVYGVISYVVGVIALVLWIAAMLGVLPFTGGPVHLSGTAAVLFNLALMVAFGVQHSVMARAAFKERWTRLIVPAMERPTFVLATGLVLGPMVLLWQPLDTTIWSVGSPVVAWVFTGVALLGWAYLFLATFAISHFELFGLRQVAQYARGAEVTAVPFGERLMYRFDRHPIMTGALVGMWVTPTMQVDHLMFAAAATVYIVIGVTFEERALLRRWGPVYADYKARVPSVVPALTGTVALAPEPPAD